MKGVLEVHPGVFESSPMADRAVEEFFAALEEIKAVAVLAGSDTIGETATKKLAKERLVRLFKTTDALLERKLDRFVFRLKEKIPGFYDAYSHARLIDDL